MSKPYIKLNKNLPGIVSLFDYDKEVGDILSYMAQVIMRRKRGLTPGQREYIAAYVSKLNNCDFCYRSHASCAVNLIPNFDDKKVKTRKMQELMLIAGIITKGSMEDLPKVINGAKILASEEEIYDTVLITSFFNMCNRYVDGLGTTFKKGEPEKGGLRLANNGYV